MALWKSGETLHLDNETERLATQAQKNRQAQDEWKDLIESWLNKPIPKNYWDISEEIDGDPFGWQRNRHPAQCRTDAFTRLGHRFVWQSDDGKGWNAS